MLIEKELQLVFIYYKLLDISVDHIWIPDDPMWGCNP